MADNRVKITIETDAGRSEQVLNGVKDSLQKVENQYKETGKESQTFAATTDKAINSVATSLKNLVAAFSSVKVAKDAFFLAQDAAKYNEIALYAKNAAEAVGISFDKMMEASRRGVSGTISNMKIMQSNMKALKLGLQADAEQMGKLWEVARHASKETGETVEYTFDKITKAISTGNARSLISMGVLSDSFARAKDAAGLLSKRGELLNNVLEQLGERTKELGDVGETSYDKYKKLDVAFLGLKNTIGQTLLPAFESMVEWLTKIITKGDEALKVLQNPVFWRQKDNIDVNEYRTTNQLKKELEKNQELIKKYKAIPKEQIEAMSEEEFNKYREAFANVKAINDELKKREDLDKKRIENQVKLFLKSEEFNKELEKSKNITEIMLRLGGGLAGSFDKAAANAKKLEQQEQAMAAKARKAQEDLIQKSLDEIQAFHENSLAATEFGATLENLSSKSLVDMQKSLADGKTSLYEFGAEITAVFSDFVSGDMITGLANIGQKLDPLEQTLREIDEDFKSWSQKIDDLQEIENILNGISKVDFSDLEKGLSNADTRMQTATNFMLTQAMGAASQATGVLDITKSTKPEETIKKGWAAIKGQVIEGFSEAVTSGIINSNIGDALRGAISSIAASKAQSYGSNILGSLFSGKGIATGALSGFVGSIAVSAIANNWKKWFGDKNKSETMASNASTKERGSNAYLQTYAAMLNPFMTDEMLNDLYSTRWASSGMYVSWKSSRRGGLAGLAGGKNYTDTTPQSTYDLISAMENAVDAIKEYNKEKEKELDLLSAQGYDYRVLTEQLGALSDAVDRANWMSDSYSHSWTSGETFSIDLSDNIQDLKKAYYEALREYGEETGARNQQKASTFLSLFPYLDNYDMGSWKSLYSNQRIEGNDNSAWAYSYIGGTQENLLNRIADPDMLKMIQQAGFEQFNLASMQYTTEDTSKYTQAYLNVLERQKEAAEYVMKEQERIYLDMTKTFEEQAAALETYQQAQEQYYNTKLEILAQEKAKEEQLKKEEQQAKLRSADRMEALLGFTGEMAKRGDNNIYILEGSDQIGALREMEKYIDDPEALAFVQRLITAALNKNKYGKIG